MAEKFKIRPLHDRVIVERLEEETKTAGGIYIPDNAKEKPQAAIVVAVGPGKRCDKTGEHCKLDVKVGDKVLFGKYAGSEIKHNGKEYLVMREEDIIAIED